MRSPGRNDSFARGWSRTRLEVRSARLGSHAWLSARCHVRSRCGRSHVMRPVCPRRCDDAHPFAVQIIRLSPIVDPTATVPRVPTAIHEVNDPTLVIGVRIHLDVWRRCVVDGLHVRGFRVGPNVAARRYSTQEKRRSKEERCLERYHGNTDLKQAACRCQIYVRPLPFSRVATS